MPTTADRSPYSVQRPAEAPVVPAVERRNGTEGAGTAEISWETPRDEKFAKFVRDHSGGMIRKAAVGLEQNGLVQIELDKSVAPDDTLSLTKSVMAGARKDFPGHPITLKVFDPAGEPILTARYRPDHGVSYHLAHGGSASGGEQAAAPAPAPDRQAPQPADALARSGVTEKDRKFAAWAKEHGRAYLLYVQADLERNGRLWFGVTPEVKPDDVPQLTKSLLEGAMTEFPKRELVATVFDPEGERIGKAHLDAHGGVRWEK
jgi:hypothetical protein